MLGCDELPFLVLPVEGKQMTALPRVGGGLFLPLSGL